MEVRIRRALYSWLSRPDWHEFDDWAIKEHLSEEYSGNWLDVDESGLYETILNMVSEFHMEKDKAFLEEWAKDAAGRTMHILRKLSEEKDAY